MPGTALGSDGLPVCSDFACRNWGCYCSRADAYVEPCEHGNHPWDCAACEPIHAAIDAIDLEVARTGQLPAPGPDSTPGPVCTPRTHGHDPDT